MCIRDSSGAPSAVKEHVAVEDGSIEIATSSGKSSTKKHTVVAEGSNEDTTSENSASGKLAVVERNKENENTPSTPVQQRNTRRASARGTGRQANLQPTRQSTARKCKTRISYV